MKHQSVLGRQTARSVLSQLGMPKSDIDYFETVRLADLCDRDGDRLFLDEEINPDGDDYPEYFASAVLGHTTRRAEAGMTVCAILYDPHQDLLQPLQKEAEKRINLVLSPRRRAPVQAVIKKEIRVAKSAKNIITLTMEAKDFDIVDEEGQHLYYSISRPNAFTVSGTVFGEAVTGSGAYRAFLEHPLFIIEVEAGLREETMAAVRDALTKSLTKGSVTRMKMSLSKNPHPERFYVPASLAE